MCGPRCAHEQDGGVMDGLRWETAELLALGRMLDERPEALRGESVAMWLAATLLRVRDRRGAEVPLLANGVQRAFESRRGQRNVVLKARQMGMTTWVAGRFFLKTITQPGILTVQVAQTREAAEGIFRVVQRFWEALPAELREGPLRLSRLNAGQMRFERIDSEFRVLSAGDENAGRGLTIQQLHCSEVSRWPGDAAMTLAGLRAALAPQGEMVMESTANGAYGCFYDEWLSAAEKDVTRHFFPWWMEPEYVSSAPAEMTADEIALMAAHGLRGEQIGFRRVLEREYRGMRGQEFAEDAQSCFRATGDCYFDVDAIDRRLGQVAAPAELRHGGTIEVWLPPVSGREYLVAVDTAGGGSDGDYAVVQVLEMETGLQCAELRRHVGVRELARVAAALAREYRDALLVVERNNHGAAVLAYLEGDERYSRVYEQGGLPGWLTTAANKPKMISRLGGLLAEEPWLFSSRRLLTECRTFVSLPGGRMGAAAGAHDDCVMAMAIGQAVRTEMLALREARMAKATDLSSILERRGVAGGGSGGAGDWADARRRAESADGWRR